MSRKLFGRIGRFAYSLTQQSYEFVEGFFVSGTPKPAVAGYGERMKNHRSFKMFAALVAVTSLVLVGCGTDDETGSDINAVSDVDAGLGAESDVADDENGAGDSGDSGVAGDAGVVDDDGGFGADDENGELPGEVIDIFPYEGAELGVVGVDAADTLNIRSGPATSYEVVAELAPLADNLVATGNNRSVDDAIWVEVTVDGVSGWVNSSFVSHLGAPRDVTADLADPTMSESTIINLVDAIVEDRFGGEITPDVVTSSEEFDDAGAVLTIDVLGLQDDSVAGERLHIVAGPADVGAGYALVSLESTVLCSRGVSEGLCL